MEVICQAAQALAQVAEHGDEHFGQVGFNNQKIQKDRSFPKIGSLHIVLGEVCGLGVVAALGRCGCQGQEGREGL